MDQDNDEVKDSPPKPVNPCIVCGKEKASYKCPKCLAKYCSVNCCKAHKSSGECGEVLPKPELPEPEQKQVQRNYYFPTKDTIPREKLELLAKGDNLIQLKKFLEDPTIKSNVLTLDTCANPINEFENIMTNENFVKFAAFVTDQLNPGAAAKRPKLDLDSD